MFCSSKCHRSFTRRGGFTLVEVMFAVITLGIGLIMVAAMFPVAIQQRALTSEEGSAAAVAPAAVSIVTQVARDNYPTPPAVANPVYSFPATSKATYTDSTGTHGYPGVIKSLRNPQSPASGALPAGPPSIDPFKLISGNMVLASDTRYAFSLLYRRDGQTPAGAVPDATELASWSQTAQVMVFVLKARNTSVFSSADFGPASTVGFVNLQPRPIKVKIDGTLQQITITPVTFTVNGITYTSDGAAVEGAFVVISDDGLPVPNMGRFNGHIYRLGAFVSGTTWELAPGYTFTPENGITGFTTNIDAFIMGRGFADPANPPTTPDGYSGPAMDIAVYTAFVPIK